MRVLFLCRLFYPHIGGVEKHVFEVARCLKRKKIKVVVITEKYDAGLKDKEEVRGIEVLRISYPKVKFFGLFYIWFWTIKNIGLFLQSDIVHAHDVSIWYLPLRIILPTKPFFSTFHGWEGKYPIPYEGALLKRLSALISDRFICVGKYIEKYYGINADFVLYGGVSTKSIHSNLLRKRKNTILFLGRLEPSTGVLNFLNWLSRNKEYTVLFCGDGTLKKICEKYGKVLGFADPDPYLKTAQICVPGGYLSALEAMSFRCKLKVFWNNELKRDYWKMTPFYRWITEEDIKKAENWVKTQTWEKVSKDYFKLWGLFK